MGDKAGPRLSMTSDEVNYLIYRYLQEAGFHHAAFTFGNESMVVNANINSSEVPNGALISYLQKGLQYKEIETHLSENGQEIDCKQDFSLLTPHVCQIQKKVEKEEAVPMDISKEPESMETSANVITLEGHTSEVFICAWNPKRSFLASGSGDSTARIWQIPESNLSAPGASELAQNNIELRQTNSNNSDKSRDVTTLDWNPDGSLLATGSYDGLARIWTCSGELKTTLDMHKGPIFSLKWNKRGDYLLSGSVDKTAIVWDAKNGSVVQQFAHHSGPTLDVDWRDDTSFATSSIDKMIYVCQVGSNEVLKSFAGHTDEVNAIKWDPTGRLLASCSDDYTAKIWTIDSEKCHYDFRQHTKEIYTIRWSPTGPGTANPNRPLVLASASFDATVKIWDVEVGKEILNLTKHVDPVYSVAFSPSGEFVASGSFDRCLHIWSLKDGSLVKTYKGEGGIFEVCWNNKGDKVAACFSNSTVCVLDFPQYFRKFVRISLMLEDQKGLSLD